VVYVIAETLKRDRRPHCGCCSDLSRVATVSSKQSQLIHLLKTVSDRVLAHVLHNPDQARNKLFGVEAHLANFTDRWVDEEYVEVFPSLIP
jgi:hypothetical protein